ncbi:hypothetical protein [Pseudomonas glycinae]|nr:hypothetical protein [Pseudomonas glycinae]
MPTSSPRSILINLIALAASLIVMNIYDRVLSKQAASMVWILVLGITDCA